MQYRVLVGVAVIVVLLASSVTTANAATSGSRDQAVRMAKQYLEFKGFCMKGLIRQLKYEGFSASDAAYGATHAGANWKRQAARLAKDYLEFQAFSRSGLVKQLIYEGCTRTQALYGARAAGL